MLGGKIWVESEPQIGSTFFFTVPYSSVKENQKRQNKNTGEDFENTPRKFKILIAEDDEISLKFLMEITQNLCKDILSAQNGIEAVDICRKNPDIDLILMDIQMPEMNGYMATRQIREFNKNVIIIAKTAFALSEDYEKASEAGCNDYISKPINRNKLIETIYKNLNIK